MLAPYCIISATLRPSRAPSTTASQISAMASGWLSLTPRAIKSPEETQPKPEKPSELLRLEGQLTEYFSTKVAISQGPKGKGKIQIDFTSDQELAEIIAKLNG